MARAETDISEPKKVKLRISAQDLKKARGGEGDDAKSQNRLKSKDRHRARILKTLNNVKHIAEIGVWRGRFSKTLLDTFDPEKLYLIDPWTAGAETENFEATFAASPKTNLDDMFAEVQSQFKSEINAGQIELRRMFPEQALKGFFDQSLDLIYVDWDHSYENVTNDLALCFKAIKLGGFIMLDGYDLRRDEGNGVIRAVNEFLGQNSTHVRIYAMQGSQICLQRQPED